MFKLVDSGWEQVFQAAVQANTGEMMIACPFIKRRTLERLLSQARCSSVRVLTRLSEREIYERVSDISALELLLERGAEIRGIQNLHSKLFIFGNSSVVAGSANLTEAAWKRNFEFGFSSSEPEVIQGCRDYFDSLWGRSSAGLSNELLAAMKAKVESAWNNVPKTDGFLFNDHGQKLPEFEAPVSFDALPTRSFVKFFAEGHKRTSPDTPVLQIVDWDGSHYACTYPLGKRPRQVKSGDTVFFGHFVPGDLLIYGRGIAEAHVDWRDTATDEEKERRPWKHEWPHYIRVHDVEFIAGMLGDGVSLNDLKSELGPYCFRSSAERARAGQTGVTPGSAYRQKPHVELTAEGWAWVTRHLQQSFARVGKLDADDLAKLDWPQISSGYSEP